MYCYHPDYDNNNYSITAHINSLTKLTTLFVVNNRLVSLILCYKFRNQVNIDNTKEPF